MQFSVTEHVLKTKRHTTFYLACGALDAPLIIFFHGWPELSISWRHQLQCFASLGFRTIAPDMRGYGRSTIHPDYRDYDMRSIVFDMIELLRSLQQPSAIWVGHDWGAPVAWSLAQHHPDQVEATANLCVPYMPLGFAPKHLIPHVNREIYPLSEFPVGQWDYQLFYEENFHKASATFDVNPRNTIKALFRRGDAAGRGKPGRLAMVSRDGGWFGGAGKAPDVPLDEALLTEKELDQYADALKQNGFSGPDSWYMNAQTNLEFAQSAANGGRLSMPVLFFHAEFDYTCETVTSSLAEPMREACDDLSELIIPSGHWMTQERPDLVNAGLARWLVDKLPHRWPI
jgi:pimeloyl-ACP methyl ester carboxylesterase